MKISSRGTLIIGGSSGIGLAHTLLAKGGSVTADFATSEGRAITIRRGIDRVSTAMAVVRSADTPVFFIAWVVNALCSSSQYPKMPSTA
jgi:hypothetical protein